MRVQTERTIAYQDTRLVFSASEQATLRRAASIARQARRLATQVVGPDWEQDDRDTMLAEIEHNPGELVDGLLLRTNYGPPK